MKKIRISVRTVARPVGKHIRVTTTTHIGNKSRTITKTYR